MSVDQTKKVSYTITSDPTINNERYGITEELDVQINRLFFEIDKPKKNKSIDKLTQLIEQYPQVPILKNYLSIAYETLGLHNKAYEIVEQTIQEHPDYIFAKINRANIAIDEGDFAKAEELLGKEMELSVLYPDRTTFHIDEVTNFVQQNLHLMKH